MQTTHPLQHHIRKIEHFSYRAGEEEKEQAAINRLCDRCAHLERIGVPVNTITVIWNWPWFETSQPNDPWNNVLVNLCDIFIHRETGEVAIPDNHRTPDDAPTPFTSYRGGARSKRTIPAHQDGHYRAFLAAGYDYANVGQEQHLGLCYATREQMIAFLTKHGITPDRPPFHIAERMAA
jgi:hypothetical protein